MGRASESVCSAPCPETGQKGLTLQVRFPNPAAILEVKCVISNKRHV